MCLKRQNQSDCPEEQKHYSAELDTSDRIISLVPFSATRQIESQQNWPIYNSLHADEITCSTDHQIPPLFFVQPYYGKQIGGFGQEKGDSVSLVSWGDGQPYKI